MRTNSYICPRCGGQCHWLPTHAGYISVDAVSADDKRMKHRCPALQQTKKEIEMSEVKEKKEKRACYPLEMNVTSYQALKAICAHDGRSIKDGLSIAIEDYVSKRALMVARSLQNTSEKIREREEADEG